MPKQLVIIVNPEHRWPMLESKLPFLGGELIVVPIEDSTGYKQGLADHPECLLVFNLAPNSGSAQIAIHNIQNEAAREAVPCSIFSVEDGVHSAAGEMLVEIVLSHEVPLPSLTA